MRSHMIVTKTQRTDNATLILRIFNLALHPHINNYLPCAIDLGSLTKIAY